MTVDERPGPETHWRDPGPHPSDFGRSAWSRRRRGRFLLPGEAGMVMAWMVASGLVFWFVYGTGTHTITGNAAAISFAVATGVMVFAIVAFSRLSSRRVRIGLIDADKALHSMELVTDPALSFLPLDTLLDELLGRTRQVVGGDLATVLLLTADEKSVSVRVSQGDSALAIGQEVPVGFGIIGAVASRGQAAIVDDVSRVQQTLPGLSQHVTSLMAAPLLVGGRVIGVVLVGAREAHGFGQRDLHLLQLVAERAAASIERARLDESERRSRLGAEQARRHLDLLAKAGEVLATALESYEDVFVRMVDVVVPAFADWFAIDLVGDDGKVGRVAYGTRGEAPRGVGEGGSPARMGETGFHRHRHPDGERLIRRSLASGRPEVVLNPTRLGAEHSGQLAPRGGFTDAAPAAGVESMIVVPIFVRGLAFGALSFVTGLDRRGYRRSDLDTAQGLAGRVAVTIERVLLWRETRQAEKAATRNAAQLHRLVEAALGVNAPLEEPEVLRVLADYARHVLDGDWAVVGSLADEGATRVELVSPPAAPVAAGVDPGVLADACGEVFRQGKAVHSGKAQWRGSPTWMGVPVPASSASGPRAVAVFATDGRTFSAEAESMLLLLTQMASVALENARLYQAAQGNEERLRAVVESAPLSIAELDLEGDAQSWNSAAAELFGWPVPQVPGTPGPSGSVARRIPVRDDAIVELRSLLDGARAGQATVGAELAARHPDGRSLELSISTAPLRDHAGVVRGILAVVEDVTERVQMLEQFHQAERLSAMARLAGAVAHDFNNLLTVILGSSEILLRSLAEQQTRDEVAAIQRAGQRAAALTSQLLAIGQRPPVQPVVIDPDHTIASMTPMLTRAMGPGVVLDHRSASSPQYVIVDPAELERAVLNLALNANDAMPEGGRFTITTVPATADGEVNGQAERQVAIRISDQGAGMDAETALHCFEPFFTTKGRARGTGLGLAAVHAIVTQAGGTVTVDSTPGHGTTFTLTFPFADREPDAEFDEDVAFAGPELSTGDETVLLVEDEDELRRLAVQALEWRGYRVLAAPDGESALDLAQGLEQRPDLVVTDVVMPHMSGVELARRMRRRWRTLSILYVSGHLDQEALGPEPHGGPADLLVKPFTPDQLAQRVRQAIDRAAARSQRSKSAAGQHGSRG